MASAISDIVDKTYDYVIVGGGTAGLVVASRLSADPTISVLVLEAGGSHVGDPNIETPGQFATQFCVAKYDWAFKSVPQKHVDGRELFCNRGKGLGGSSAINGQCFVVPPYQDVDAIEALGNPGWNWKNFSKYIKRVFDQVPNAIPHRSKAFDDLYFDTLAGMGLKENKDPYNGNNVGPFLTSASINPETWKRTYSVTAYYDHAKNRPNLTVVTHALVSRVIFKDDPANELTATGAEFIHEGKTYVARSNKEVIISAGALKSPQVLELSGIGRRDVLEKIGIKVKLELPGVGENSQEHTLSLVSYETKPNDTYETLDKLRDPKYAAEHMKLHNEGKGMPSVHVTSYSYIPGIVAVPEVFPEFIKNVEGEIEELKKGGKLPPGLADQYDIQLKLLRDPAVPDFEIFVFPGYFNSNIPFEEGKTYFTLMYLGNRLFSRGTVHAQSSDPEQDPAIDPNYFSIDYDLQLMAEHVRYGRKIVAHEPLKSALVRELEPGWEVTDDASIRDHIKQSLMSGYHTVGTCAMMPREKNGVVNPELVVYGTKNVRVADLSIIPIELSTHPQSIAYAIGEKLSDIILGK